MFDSMRVGLLKWNRDQTTLPGGRIPNGIEVVAGSLFLPSDSSLQDAGSQICSNEKTSGDPATKQFTIGKVLVEIRNIARVVSVNLS